MGSNSSKRRNFSSFDEASSEASSRTNSLVKKKKRQRKKNIDAVSITSVESRTSSIDVSYVPNGRITNGRKADEKIPNLNGNIPNGKVSSEGVTCEKITEKTLDRNGDKLSIKSICDDPELLCASDNRSDCSSGNVDSCKVDCNDNKLKCTNVDSGCLLEPNLDDGIEKVPDVSLHPDSGAGYNGGGALPKRGSAQDTLTRLMKNGFGTGKKSSLQLFFECSRDDTKKKLSQLCDVAFLPSGHVALSTSAVGKSGLQVYPLTDPGQPATVLGGSCLAAPRGICVGASDCIAVTDWNDRTVSFLTIEGEYINSWKTNKFQHPGGIAINRDGRYIVADITRKEAAIGLYTPYGKLLRRFGTDVFDWPWYVAVDHKNRILVSERKSSVVSVFDDVGHFLFKFGGSETPGTSGKSVRVEEQLNSPGGITVDSQDNILVADTDNYRVGLFSPDGLFIKTMVTMRSSRPISLCYDDGHLAVITDNDLRVYKTYADKTSL
ncbi:hypothetical protein LSH36_91g02034 [Paralvinella palmiformis]|uniref:Uncharacterized protein n=1 Tax=Paralvinella palmiformis TaxID=53620 RepID=A0AAD9K2L5_9ANNE|nr:hypothetical protein LSH36_91g02034 [Paralvinella palmiformis]